MVASPLPRAGDRGPFWSRATLRCRIFDQAKLTQFFHYTMGGLAGDSANTGLPAHPPCPSIRKTILNRARLAPGPATASMFKLYCKTNPLALAPECADLSACSMGFARTITWSLVKNCCQVPDQWIHLWGLWSGRTPAGIALFCTSSDNCESE